jgi:hypothetical protein
MSLGRWLSTPKDLTSICRRLSWARSSPRGAAIHIGKTDTAPTFFASTLAECRIYRLEKLRKKLTAGKHGRSGQFMPRLMCGLGRKTCGIA